MGLVLACAEQVTEALWEPHPVRQELGCARPWMLH